MILQLKIVRNTRLQMRYRENYKNNILIEYIVDYVKVIRKLKIIFQNINTMWLFKKILLLTFFIFLEIKLICNSSIIIVIATS